MSLRNSPLLITGTYHAGLAQSVADHLKLKLCKTNIETFSNGEVAVKILESVRGEDVFVIQSHANDINSAIIEQALIIDAAMRSDARSITAVCPFLAYARQDRKSNVREPISAKVIVDILISAGATRLMSVDLHSGQIQGFASAPFDHIIARPILTQFLRDNFKSNELVIVSPDAGRVKSAERYSNELKCDLAIVHKHRVLDQRNVSEAKELIGSVQGKVCILIDDMIDTAGTICAAADLIAQRGASKIYGLTTHGIFSGPALRRIEKSAFEKIITTNTLPPVSQIDKISYVDIAPLLAKAIQAAYSGDSISALFDGNNLH